MILGNRSQHLPSFHNLYKLLGNRNCFAGQHVMLISTFLEVDIFENDTEIRIVLSMVECEGQETPHPCQEYDGRARVQFLISRTLNFLTNQPVIIIASSSDIREFTGSDPIVCKTLNIFLSVKRLNTEAFVCARQTSFLSKSAPFKSAVILAFHSSAETGENTSKRVSFFLPLQIAFVYDIDWFN